MRSRTIPLLLVLSVLAAACAGAAVSDPASTTSIGLEPMAAADLIAANVAAADFVLLDVRTPEEFVAGHIAGAANLDFYRADFATALAGLDRDARYLVYCRSGNRSASTVSLMHDLGFATVYEVNGGVIDWQADGLPLVGS